MSKSIDLQVILSIIRKVKGTIENHETMIFFSESQEKTQYSDKFLMIFPDNFRVYFP